MDVNDLESAINKVSPKVDSKTKKVAETPELSRDEEIGFHKGALSTLILERNEMVKIIGNVESIMQAHISRLKELGVDIK